MGHKYGPYMQAIFTGSVYRALASSRVPVLIDCILVLKLFSVVCD